MEGDLTCSLRCSARFLSAGVASSCGFMCFSVGAGLLFRWRREADFGGLLRFLPPVLCGARLSFRVGSVLWGMSTAQLVFDVLLGDATLAYTCGAPCLARDCPGGFCPLSRGSCPLAPLLCESYRASDLTLRASLAWAFVARFPRSRGVGLHVWRKSHGPHSCPQVQVTDFGWIHLS